MLNNHVDRNNLKGSLNNILVIIPVRNRCHTTIKCLRSLSNLNIYSNIILKILIIDDGSTDGTSQAIRSEFPDVFIVNGDGNFYWSGAIQYGFSIAQNYNADFIWMLNDDLQLDKDCLKNLLDTYYMIPNAIYIGSVFDSKGCLIYGGMKRKPLFRFERINPNLCSNQNIDADTMNGNCVLIPTNILSNLKMPKLGIYVHEGFDMFLGLEAKKRGLRLIVVKDAKALGVPNNNKFFFFKNEENFRTRWSAVTSVKGIYPPMYWHLCTRYGGILGALLFFWPYIKVLIAGFGKRTSSY